MHPQYEEKTFESYFNNELDQLCSIYFPLGQVQEGGLGADAAAFSANPQLWSRFGLKFPIPGEFEGASLPDIAGAMDILIHREVQNLPPITVNLLLQYKRPEVIASALGSEWSHWNQKYYRYKIDSHQQALLERIHAKFGNAALIIYAAPAIDNILDLVQKKLARRIVETTNFCRAQALTGHSRNTYISAGHHSIACSEPITIERVNLSQILNGARAVDQSNKTDQLVTFAGAVRAVVLADAKYGPAYRIALQEYVAAGINDFDTLYAMISMKVLRDITGIQWLVGTQHIDV